MSLQEQEAVLAQVEEAGWGKPKLLAQLHVPRSTYYRWQSQQRQGKLGSSSQHPKIPWNRLSSQEEAVVLANARKYSDLSSRQLAAWITDHQGFSVSEATVYRILESGQVLSLTSGTSRLSRKSGWVWLEERCVQPESGNEGDRMNQVTYPHCRWSDS